MFTLASLTLPVLIAVAGFTVGIIRWIYTAFFSKSAKAEAVLQWAERGQVRLEAELDRLRAANAKIDAAPPPATDQELQDRINDAWNKKP